MLQRALQETLSFILTVVLVLTLVFLAVRALPGDPASIRGGTDASAAQVEAMRRALGLDLPLLSQYRDYWRDLLSGSLGESIRERRAVLAILYERLPVTLSLAALAFALSVLLGVGLGLLAGLRPNGRFDQTVLGFTTLGLTLPEFWLGFLLILLLAVRLSWFPLLGYPVEGGLLVRLHHLVLPTLTLAIPRAAVLARLSRAQMLEERRADYVRTARSKGLPPLALAHHIAANALSHLFPLLALELGGLLTGTIVVEQVFGLPGLGVTLLGAIAARDYPVIQGITVVAVLVYVLINWLADLAQTLTNPRLRYT